MDVDGEPGVSALLAYLQQGQELPDTLSVSTGRGTHIYFRWPEGQNVRNSAGKLAAGLDIRGDGGYVVIPPSIHASGDTYSYTDPNELVADAPVWLLALLRETTSGPMLVSSQPQGAIPEGKRNSTLTSLAGTMRRRGMSKEAIEAALLQENRLHCHPPLPGAEVQGIAASAARYPIFSADLPTPVSWLTTSSMKARREDDAPPTFSNPAEAELITILLKRLERICQQQVRSFSVAILSGYSGQKHQIQRRLASERFDQLVISCDTVDAVQGREADLAIYSVTRSNPKNKLGFLAEERRLNVALSRAKQYLVIVGDHDFAKRVPGENPFAKVLAYIERHPGDCTIRDFMEKQ